MKDPCDPCDPEKHGFTGLIVPREIGGEWAT